jgi:hypothetical protein
MSDSMSVMKTGMLIDMKLIHIRFRLVYTHTFIVAARFIGICAHNTYDMFI